MVRLNERGNVEIEISEEMQALNDKLQQELSQVPGAGGGQEGPAMGFAALMQQDSTSPMPSGQTNEPDTTKEEAIKKLEEEGDSTPRELEEARIRDRDFTFIDDTPYTLNVSSQSITFYATKPMMESLNGDDYSPVFVVDDAVIFTESLRPSSYDWEYKSPVEKSRGAENTVSTEYNTWTLPASCPPVDGENEVYRFYGDGVAGIRFKQNTK